MAAASENVRTLARCPHCLGPMPPAKKTGRPRRWCSDACRHAAKERRRAEIAWASAGDDLPEIPDDPQTHRMRTLTAVAELLDGEGAGPPEDRLAQGLVELRQLVYSLRRLAPELHPTLRARTWGLADATNTALTRYFSEVLP